MRARTASPAFPASPRRGRPALLGLALLALAGAARADVVELKDGRRIEGKVLSRTAEEVVVKTSFATLTFRASEVVRIVKEKTREELHDEKRAACKTARDFFELGNWCAENRLKKEAEAAWLDAVALEPDHAGARAALGHVRFEGRWIPAEERDRVLAEREAAAAEAKGLVRHEGRWVTPEERRRLVEGWVAVDGEWLSPDDAKRRQGLELFQGAWIPAERARDLSLVAEASRVALRDLDLVTREGFVVAGTVHRGLLDQIAEGLVAGRAKLGDALRIPPGLAIFGGRPAEFWTFLDDSSYELLCPWLLGRSEWVPEGWSEAVQGTHGFTWTDPVAISSIRLWNRNERDLLGHSYHHLGHVILNRLGYDGRLLPPWYDEGWAALCELRVHGATTVFCKSSSSASEGSIAVGEERFQLDDDAMRYGNWREELRRALRTGQVPAFDQLAQRDFAQLDLTDIATSIVILEWIESRGPTALRAFHDALRIGAPVAPARVILKGNERQRVYDEAFRAASELGFREADRAWREWFLKR